MLLLQLFEKKDIHLLYQLGHWKGISTFSKSF